MRALTVRQPYAWAIIHGQKDVENRTRNLAGSYRGPVAITASVKPDREAQFPHDVAIPLRGMEALTGRGVILGVVNLVDVHRDQIMRGTSLHCCSSPEWHGGPPCPGPCSPWAEARSYHLVLANPCPLPTPIPVRGRLGLWTLPDDIAAQVEEALR